MVSEERVASVDIRNLDTPIKSLYLQPMKGSSLVGLSTSEIPHGFLELQRKSENSEP